MKFILTQKHESTFFLNIYLAIVLQGKGKELFTLCLLCTKIDQNTNINWNM